MAKKYWILLGVVFVALVLLLAFSLWGTTLLSDKRNCWRLHRNLYRNSSRTSISPPRQNGLCS